MMPKLMLLYSTQEGQTLKIATFVRDIAERAGWRVDMRDAATVTAAPLPAADALLLAASVHFGRHAPAVQKLVLDRRAALEAVPSAFLSVSLSATGDRGVAAEGYADDFLEATGWHPAARAEVAGALRYRSYGLLKRMLMKQIARSQGLHTDSSRDYEYTDWLALEEFVADFLRTAVASPANGHARR